MASKFTRLAENFFIAPQIEAEDVAEAARLGVRLIVNNRPDLEEPGQPSGAEIEAAARAAGLDYRFIPVGPAGIGESELGALADALDKTQGPVLAYCRSGRRSTVLRALLKARQGAPADALVAEAAGAGQDIAALAPQLDALAQSRR